jgi:hypothetical protein
LTNITAEVGVETASSLHSSFGAYFAAAGNGSMYSLAFSNSWTQGDFYQFAASSAGYQNISIAYDQHGLQPGAGPSAFYLEYSVDGSTFAKFGSDYTINYDAWSSATRNAADSYSFNLSSVASLNGQSTIYFRIVDDSAGTVYGLGSIDNVLITAQPVPEPSTMAMLLSGCACLMLIGRRKCARG